MRLLGMNSPSKYYECFFEDLVSPAWHPWDPLPTNTL